MRQTYTLQMTTNPQSVGPVFSVHFAHREKNPDCPVQIVYRHQIGIPQTKDPAGVWQINMLAGRKTIAQSVASGLAGMDETDPRPLVLDIEAPQNPMLTALCVDLARWMFPGRAVGQIGDVPVPGGSRLYPMAYMGRAGLAENYLVKLDSAYNGRRIVPLVWNKVASGKFAGLYVTDADNEAMARMLAKWLVEVDGTGTVIGWSDAKTPTEERRFLAWFAALEARTRKIVAEKQAALQTE